MCVPHEKKNQSWQSQCSMSVTLFTKHTAGKVSNHYRRFARGAWLCAFNNIHTDVVPPSLEILPSALVMLRVTESQKFGVQSPKHGEYESD